MFNKDFYPTPNNVIEMMLNGENINEKIILEPSAGKGDIVDYLKNNGAKNVIACELNADLKKIVQTKCKVIADDFLTLKSEQVSHVDMIVMNPPFSADEKHILHAFEIAPKGCRIIAICNTDTLKTYGYKVREQLLNVIEKYGQSVDLGEVFNNAERSTNVSVSVVTITKPGDNYANEFEGFFLDEDPAEDQENSIMPYNVVRDLVNRYIAAVKIFDQQLETAVRLNELTKDYFFTKQPELGISVNRLSVPVKRNEFKKEMQKEGWTFIFSKMNMQKHSTKGLREDINKFVEQQQQIPFTMRNIYRMLEIVIGTQSQRMDKAILEAFEGVTKYHDENRYGLEGWKTNSHFLLTETFILPWMVDTSKWSWNKHKIGLSYNGNVELVEDMVKALCHITGTNYDETTPLSSFVRNIDCEYGKWYSWGFFEIKGYKKGTMHFKFQNKDIWAKFNQHVARLKGYPLYEAKKQTNHQDRQTGRAQQEKSDFRQKYSPFFAE